MLILFCGPIGWDGIQKTSVHSALWFLWIHSMFRAAGFIQFCGPFGGTAFRKQMFNQCGGSLLRRTVFRKEHVHSVLWPLCIQSMFRATRWSSGAQRIVLLCRWCFRAHLVWLRSCGSSCSSLSSLSVRVLCKSFTPARG